jgi:hypothetical protein
MKVSILVALFSMFITGASFSLSPRVQSRLITQNFMAAESSESNQELPDELVADKKLFDMNRRVRLGRSRDQDGKSNIWSIEPTMQVVEDEADDLKKNLAVGGAVIGAALVSLPLFTAFSTLFPNPADF